MFTHLPTVYKEVLKERRIKHKRHYETPNGKLYRSVTTVTGILGKKNIQEWRDRIGHDLADYQMIQAGNVGTEMHNINEDYLNNMSVEDIEKKYPKLVGRAHFYNIKEELDKINNIHTLEAGIYSNKYEIAGRVDCIAEYDGVLSVIDFKTSKYSKPEEWILAYYVQASLYKQCWLERTKEDIKQIVILMTGLDGSVTVYKKNPDDYVKEIIKTIKLYEESLEDNG